MDQLESNASLWRRLFSDEAGTSLIASGTQHYSPCDLRTCDGRIYYTIPLLVDVGSDSFGGRAPELLSGLCGTSYVRLLTGMRGSVAAAVRLRQNDVYQLGTRATWHSTRLAL